MRKLILASCLASFVMAGCSKTEEPSAGTVSQSDVINGFVKTVALPQYTDLHNNAVTLNNAIKTLNTTPTSSNLDAARSAWRNTRSVWEQCEGFLIGPVSDDNYDPNMDTWPVDYAQLDSFITTSSSFSTTTIAGLNQALRGFHPLEYILWGKGGKATVDSISAKDKQYMLGLAQDIEDNTNALNNSWLTTGDNFQAKLLTAGNGSTLYTKQVDAMLAVVAGMADICGEVGEGKIKEPFDLTDSTLTESPFSHNSITDFTNNIKGALNVYTCTYNGQTGKSMSNYVALRNLQLDNKIKDQFNAAIAALGNVTVPFETAIHTQRTQLQAAMTAISSLKAYLESDLKTYVQTYGKD